MLSRPVTELPGPTAYPGGTVFEPKWDGFRALIFRAPSGAVEIQSRSGRPLTRYFPEIVRVAREHLPGGVVLDGELIVWSSGRLSFPLLQRRMVGGLRTTIGRSLEPPAHLVAFDVLHTPRRRDVRRLPLA